MRKFKITKELQYILDKYNLNIETKQPVEIRNVGRDNLPQLFKELGYSKGVEIGVERGIYSEILCKGYPEMTLYGVDPWKAYRGYRDHVSQDKLDGFYETTVERMRGYNYIPIRSFSMDALKQFGDETLDFVYIDGNHDFINVARDIFYWEQKVRVGGMVAGHDYRENRKFVSSNHVVPVVNAYTKSYRIYPWFLLGTKEEVPGEIRDKNRTWMWIRDGLKDR